MKPLWSYWNSSNFWHILTVTLDWERFYLIQLLPALIFAEIRKKLAAYNLLTHTVHDDVVVWETKPESITGPLFTYDFSLQLKLNIRFLSSEFKWRDHYKLCSCHNSRAVETLAKYELGNSVATEQHFARNIFKYISLSEALHILIDISISFVLKGQLTLNEDWFLIMAWCHTGNIT